MTETLSSPHDRQLLLSRISQRTSQWLLMWTAAGIESELFKRSSYTYWQVAQRSCNSWGFIKYRRPFGSAGEQRTCCDGHAALEHYESVEITLQNQSIILSPKAVTARPMILDASCAHCQGHMAPPSISERLNPTCRMLQ